MPKIKDVIHFQQMVARAVGRRHRVRRPRAAQYPLAIEESYRRRLRAVADMGREVLRQVLSPRISRLASEAGITRLDAYSDTLTELMRLARATTGGMLPQTEVHGIARGYADQVNTRNRREVLAILGQAVGVDIFLNDREILADVRAFVNQNVSLITSINEDYFEDVERKLLAGLRAGTRVGDLQGIIEDRWKVPAARAELIARDQVGKFNGQLTQLRHEELGIEEYDWMTVGDERVREMHADLDGERQNWNDPPETNPQGDRNHPGGDYQCRCTARPVIPKF